MAVFVEARTDPFASNRSKIANEFSSKSSRDNIPVRRPLRGIEIKEDTYGVLRVMDERGSFIPIIDSAGEIGDSRGGPQRTTSWTNFIIQSVRERRAEKKQIVETFGDSYIFFYGEDPRILAVQGYLLNSNDFNWKAEWWENYDKYFRGTRLVERSARLYLIYDDNIIEGYMLDADSSESAQNNHLVTLNFNMFVTGRSNISTIGDPNYPVPGGDIDYTQMSAYGEALSAWEGSRNLQAASTVDAVKAANQSGIILGAMQLLSDAIRRGLTSGDASIFGFIQSAAQIMAGVGSVVGAVGDLIGGSPFGDKLVPSPRNLPIRSVFTDNSDEFIGVGEEALQEAATSHFSMADAWLAMDQQMDNVLFSFELDPFNPPFMDVMGMLGRSQQEIMQRTANSLAYMRSGGKFSRLFTGPGVANKPRPAISLRSIPFGMAVMPGLL